MNHNILSKIIDKVALIKWQNKMKVMNNIYKKIVSDHYISYGYVIMRGCLSCGWCNGDNNIDGIIYYPRKELCCLQCGYYVCHNINHSSIYQIEYKYCYRCDKKKHLRCQNKTQYKKLIDKFL